MNQRTQSLLDVAVALATESSVQPILKTVMKHARRLVKADRFSLFLLDKDQQMLRSEVAEGMDEIRIPLGDGLAGYVASTGESLIVEDVYQDERYFQVENVKSNKKI